METKVHVLRDVAGFTLLEVLLSVALVAGIVSVGIPVYRSLQIRSDLDIAATSIAQSMRRAQMLAEASDGDMSWGVDVQNGAITLFKGTSYAGRDSSYDEVFSVPASITSSGMTTYVFAKFTGLPNAVGAVTLTSNTNEVRIITINAKGTVSY